MWWIAGLHLWVFRWTVDYPTTLPRDPLLAFLPSIHRARVGDRHEHFLGPTLQIERIASSPFRRFLRPRAASGSVLAPIASVPERMVRDVPAG
jgi:hypothetical protein